VPPEPRDDPYIALHTNHLRRALEPIAKLPAARRHELTAAFLLITIAVTDDGRPLPTDDAVAAVRLRENVRTWKAWRATFLKYGMLQAAAGGGWTTSIAEAELARGKARARSRALRRAQASAPADGEGNTPPPRGSEGGSDRGSDRGDRDENASAINGPKPQIAPLPPTPYPSTSNHSLSKTLRARDIALPPSLRDELERLTAEHVGDERAAELLAELKRDRLRTEADVRDEGAWARAWLRRHGVHIAKAALAPPAHRSATEGGSS